MRNYKFIAVLILLILDLMSCSGEKTMNEKSMNKNAPESAQDQQISSAPKAYFAGGCFWGVEYLFEQKGGVISAVSGYMGGSMEKPTYRDVLSGNAGHLEVVEVTYDPAKVNYEALAKYFFEIHDPTQVGGQGPDIGEQYISAVFYENEEEKKIIQMLIDILKTKGYRVVTQVRPAGTFWKAEEYHQNYYDKNRKQPYCHAYKKKF
jgi:peptide methionine sulfoxide reductase msrA/msrB